MNPLSIPSGAFLVHKPTQLSSFQVVDQIKKALSKAYRIPIRKLKCGHGGSIDPFAEGLLIIMVGQAVKLAEYFLKASKVYEGVILFGKTTASGDPTTEVTKTSTQVPSSLASLQALAHSMTQHTYAQTPPMYSAKKHHGKPLYLLARQGIEVKREPQLCHLYRFELTSYKTPRVHFKLHCSSGTYVRTLAQDFGRLAGSVALLETLTRTCCHFWTLKESTKLDELIEAIKLSPEVHTLPGWKPFSSLLSFYSKVEVTLEEAKELLQGKQRPLLTLSKRIQPTSDRLSEKYLCINYQQKLFAIAKNTPPTWKLDRVFPKQLRNVSHTCFSSRSTHLRPH